jgi:hypothetical protein
MALGANKAALLGAAGGSTTSAYTIDQSIRFNDDDSPVLTASQTGAGDTRKKNTFSVWVKRGNITSQGYIGAYRYDATNYQYWLFKADDTLEFTDVSGGSVIGKLVTTQVFRDPSAWYNLTFVWDSANAISSERMKIYVNGQRVTSLSTATYPSVNTDSGGAGRASSTMRIGTYDATGAFFDGYLTNIVYVDNSALDASSFGETNDNGIWIPKDVSGLTFGTRGFYIDGRDSADLGDDESGNGNDFTTSGLAAHDQVSDSPTNNFAVMNPLDNYYFGSTFSDGNLQVTTPNGTQYTFNTSTILVSSGKWYAEFEVHHYDSNTIGVAGQASGGSNHVLGTKNDQVGYYAPDGNYYKNNSAVSYGNSYGAGDIIGVALDLDNNNLYLSKNGTFQNSGVPTSGATGTGAISIPAPSATVDGGYRFACGEFSNNYASHNINFGQDGTFNGNVTAGGNSDGNGVGNFKYSVPNGYLALCTKNLGS